MYFYLIMILITINNLNLMSQISAPKAKQIEKKLEIHNHKRIDNYYWLNEKENPEVIKYLNQENDYCNSRMGDTKELQNNLFDEMKGRIKQNDSSVPFRDNGSYYYNRFEEGKEYAFNCRKKETLEAPEEVLFDQNQMAEGTSYFSLGGYSVSPNNKIVGFGVDIISRRQYNLRFKNIETKELYPETIPNTDGSCVWANDNKTVFYTLKDETLREYKIMRHILGNDVSKDAVIYEEKDDTFYAHCYKSKSDKFIIIASTSTMADEYRIISADKPEGECIIFAPRTRGIEYSIYNYENKFYIRTNWNAQNFKLMECPIDKTDRKNWKDVIPHREDVLIEGIELFKDFMVLEERRNGIIDLRVINNKTNEDYKIDFEESVYNAGISVNREYNTNTFRFYYTSMTTPTSSFDFDMIKKSRVLLKQQEVLGGFDKSNYKSERVFATASDGTKIPISLVYHKNTKLDGSAPLLEYGYGSYGISMDVGFSSESLSLVDRGFVYAIAHIRGGEDMGRAWYENGKLLKKKNTFTDFIECGNYLVKEKYTSKDRIFARGGSAGGLLMGAVANMAGTNYRGMIAVVPFVDIITTMLDESIPLTTGEYDEWGNPNDKTYYEYMLSYSPIDNVEKKEYPNILVMTGLHDSQVQYYEPAKWVAKLREYKTDKNLLLFNCNLDAGHGGSSGRFRRLHETALQYAFMFKLMNILK